MRAVITITEMATIRGRYLYSLKGKGARTINGYDAGNDPSAAAATAMRLAVQFEDTGYAIFAPKNVIDLIPLDMRQANAESK